MQYFYVSNTIIIDSNQQAEFEFVQVEMIAKIHYINDNSYFTLFEVDITYRPEGRRPEGDMDIYRKIN